MLRRVRRALLCTVLVLTAVLLVPGYGAASSSRGGDSTHRVRVSLDALGAGRAASPSSAVSTPPSTRAPSTCRSSPSVLRRPLDRCWSWPQPTQWPQQLGKHAPSSAARLRQIPRGCAKETAAERQHLSRWGLEREDRTAAWMNLGFD
jgi:hypothetical protein